MRSISFRRLLQNDSEPLNHDRSSLKGTIVAACSANGTYRTHAVVPVSDAMEPRCYLRKRVLSGGANHDLGTEFSSGRGRAADFKARPEWQKNSKFTHILILATAIREFWIAKTISDETDLALENHPAGGYKQRSTTTSPDRLDRTRRRTFEQLISQMRQNVANRCGD